MNNTNKKPTSPPSDPRERTWAMLAHLSAFSALIVPFGNILGPLIVWLLKKDEFPSVDIHGKESLNFQISVTIYYVISFFLIFVFIGIPMMVFAIMVFQIVCVVLATLKANVGEVFQYPLSIRFVK